MTVDETGGSSVMAELGARLFGDNRSDLIRYGQDVTGAMSDEMDIVNCIWERGPKSVL